MDCKERILSNEYADGVVDFPVERMIEKQPSQVLRRCNAL